MGRKRGIVFLNSLLGGNFTLFSMFEESTGAPCR
jgi:hypothetical protein